MTEDSPAGQLTDTERCILEIERTHWKYPAVKEDFIRTRFGWSAARHYSRLNELLRRPEAMAYDAQTVRRLQQRADALRARRQG